MRRFRFMKFLGVAVLGLCGLAAFGWVVEHLWNWLVPGIFGWRPVTYVQALGLLVLSKLLFGGFHRHGGGRRGGGGGQRGMHRRWEGMTPEQRERFRSGMREARRCGWGRWDRPEQPGQPVAEEVR